MIFQRTYALNACISYLIIFIFSTCNVHTCTINFKVTPQLSRDVFDFSQCYIKMSQDNLFHTLIACTEVLHFIVTVSSLTGRVKKNSCIQLPIPSSMPTLQKIFFQVFWWSPEHDFMNIRTVDPHTKRLSCKTRLITPLLSLRYFITASLVLLSTRILWLPVFITYRAMPR